MNFFHFIFPCVNIFFGTSSTPPISFLMVCSLHVVVQIFYLGFQYLFHYFILFYLFFWLNLLSSTTIPKDKGKHTVEALISGHPQDVKKESITGAGRL